MCNENVYPIPMNRLAVGLSTIAQQAHKVNLFSAEFFGRFCKNKGSAGVLLCTTQTHNTQNSSVMLVMA